MTWYWQGIDFPLLLYFWNRPDKNSKLRPVFISHDEGWAVDFSFSQITMKHKKKKSECGIGNGDCDFGARPTYILQGFWAAKSVSCSSKHTLQNHVIPLCVWSLCVIILWWEKTYSVDKKCHYRNLIGMYGIFSESNVDNIVLKMWGILIQSICIELEIYGNIAALAWNIKHLSEWLCGHLTVWTYERTNVLTYERTDVWTYERTDVLIYWCMDVLEWKD